MAIMVVVNILLGDMNEKAFWTTLNWIVLFVCGKLFD